MLVSYDYAAAPATIHGGDCLDVLREMGDGSVDSIVTDPPYGLSNTDPAHVVEALTKWATGDREFIPEGRGFMGKAWDAFVPPPAVWDECLRVLKPGGHLLAFAGSRTFDLMTLSIRFAGFDIRDSIAWLYGSGFPKSMDVSKAIDKAAGAEREIVGPGQYANRGRRTDNRVFGEATPSDGEVITAPATDAAREWQGWGTALKPAFEPIVVARKPFPGTVAANVLAHGTGALNIDATRIATDERIANHRGTNGAAGVTYGKRAEYVPGSANPDATHDKGRWPANVILDESQAAELDRQSGTSKSVGGSRGAGGQHGAYSPLSAQPDFAPGYGDVGGASRFFYVAKAPKSERPVVDGVAHPTVKPLSLMRQLVKLATPPGGVVLDPFAGSGTTLEAARLEGFDVIGVEADASYVPLIEARLDRVPKMGA